MQRVLHGGDLVRGWRGGHGHGRTEEENGRPRSYARERGDDTKTRTGATNIFVRLV